MISSRIAILIAIVIICLAASCGGGTGGMEPDQTGNIDPVVSLPAGQAELPLPSELERSSSEVDSQRSREGKDYLPQLSSGDNVSIEDSSCSMDPMHMGTWRLSYAGWRFYLPDYGSEHTIQLELNPEVVQDFADSYIGLSNWETDSWSWFAVPEDGLVDVGDMQPMIRDVTQSMYAVVLTDREDKLSIASLRIGGEQLPVARLKADNYFVGSGSMVELSAKDSEFFGLGVAMTEFDPEGDGNWQDSGGSSSMAHVYASEGLYTAGMRVTDTEGNIAYDYTSIYVSDGAYFEFEDNDDPSEASYVPSSGFSGLKGNIGNAGVHADSEDWFRFDLEQSALIHGTISVSGVGGYVFFDLYREVEGAEPELMARKSTIGTREFLDTFPPGNYLLAVRDNAATDDMDRDYDVELLVTTSEHPVVVIEPYVMVSDYTDIFEIDIDGSYDPDGSIIKWEVDLFGDGNYEEASNIDGKFTIASFKRPGTFEARARVTDDSWLRTYKTFMVSFEGQPAYNHLSIEPDSNVSWTELPAFDFTLMRGTLGDGSDFNDYFGFSTTEEGQIEIELDILNEKSGDLEMFLYRLDGEDWTLVDSHVSGDGSIVAAGIPAGEYYIRVHTLYGSTMYDLNGYFTP